MLMSNMEPAPDYDFIFNDPKATSSNGGTKKQRLIIFFGLIFGVIFGLIIVFNVILKPDTSAIDAIAKLSAKQAYLIDLADESYRDLRTTDSRQLAAGSITTLSSDKAKLDEVLTNNGRILRPLELSTAVDTVASDRIEAAANDNTYDQVFIDTYNDLLVSYMEQINVAYQAAESDEVKAILSTAFANAAVISGEAN